MSANSNHVNCYKPREKKLWCKECVPRCIIEGWTSENSDIDEFIKNTIYNAKYFDDDDDYNDDYPLFLEWIPYDRFENIEKIGEGGFAKVYSATWICGKTIYTRHNDSWRKREPESIKVALKKLNGSQNMTDKYLNELKTHWSLYNSNTGSLNFHGITRDPETKEFVMVMQYASEGNLRCILLNNFNNILWEEKLLSLMNSAYDLKNLHELGYLHKDFHSGNILLNYEDNENISYISDFGLSDIGSSKSDNKVCGVLPYIAPEVLNNKPYTKSSDIYSFGVIMAELSSGMPPFYERKHDVGLALDICNGLRPEFGKGTPDIYKKLAYKCMDANPEQRPKAKELYVILHFWHNSTYGNCQDIKKFGSKGREIKDFFKEADKEIPKVSISYEKNLGAIYVSRALTFSNLPEPINSPIITSFLQDSRLKNLEI
ncbi:hypothetical protein RclHR1_01570014 [Rhizophagus clarus]|uniref:Kinase-like domain-containing protein n=1 Tax=Rhizophagus clarus TaxID=94130 RepID=A0A2Z6QJY3_9GLOM|nr:hypothetical protein RclHR1_01570014 [Rhizophagus clarus]GES80902.1 kinase-like domain-containing protein [Rhizophagus clarus]